MKGKWKGKDIVNIMQEINKTYKIVMQLFLMVCNGISHLSLVEYSMVYNIYSCFDKGCPTKCKHMPQWMSISSDSLSLLD